MTICSWQAIRPSIDSTDGKENGSNQQEMNVYGNPSEYVLTVSAAEAFGDDDTPF